jgi:hypothetical protein
MEKIAILVVSHNNPALTDSLCEGIITRTKGVEYDLHVIETGSNLAKVSKYMTLWVNEGVRMTRGFNLLKEYADFTAKQKGYEYSAYHLFVNDAKFIDDYDNTTILWQQMKANPDCGEINPYQVNIPQPHVRQNKMALTGCRKESFSEIICPMIRKETWDEIPDLLDNRFFYGWGLDYDIPTKLHQTKWRLYVSDMAGIYHQAFTSYREKEQTEEKLEVGQFVNEARVNMYKGLGEIYGTDWKRAIYNLIPEDVNEESLHFWLRAQDGFIK